MNLSRELAPPGKLIADQSFEFDFSNVEKKSESYNGINARLRYDSTFLVQFCALARPFCQTHENPMFTLLIILNAMRGTNTKFDPILGLLFASGTLSSSLSLDPSPPILLLSKTFG